MQLNKLLKISHETYGPHKFNIGAWQGQSIIYEGQYFIEVSYKRNGTHKKKIYVDDNGEVGYFGPSIPDYVVAYVAAKVWNHERYFKSVFTLL